MDNPENTPPSERSQSPKGTCSAILFLCRVCDRQTHSNRRLPGGGAPERRLLGTGLLLRGPKGPKIRSCDDFTTLGRITTTELYVFNGQVVGHGDVCLSKAVV